ncbi:MAG: M23 family metallopeptidase, partial [Xanthomonadales bacterium]|nr:M23 family metallopeptidase [Xanthomonadales bacterium]
DEALATSYDFHVNDARHFYSDKSVIYSPADGVVVEIENKLDDLYDSRFDLAKAVEAGQVKHIAGNYVVIQHNDQEFSHLFHFLKGSIKGKMGQRVKAGQPLGLTGFSGAATTYSHLHYQLMDGPNFLIAESLPAKFTDITLLMGNRKTHHAEVSLDTGDIILN